MNDVVFDGVQYYLSLIDNNINALDNTMSWELVNDGYKEIKNNTLG
jgi:hypothetical protein